MFGEALVIIDMQPYFSSALNEYTIRNCIAEIKRAKRANIPIVVLEYEDPDGEDDLGETLPRLKKHLDSYHATYYVKKYDDDGGLDVMRCLEENDLDTIPNFRVCGINLGACIWETVDTLVNVFNKQVEVVKRACNCNGLNGTKTQQFKEDRLYNSNGNVSLV